MRPKPCQLTDDHHDPLHAIKHAFQTSGVAGLIEHRPGCCAPLSTEDHLLPAIMTILPIRTSFLHSTSVLPSGKPSQATRRDHKTPSLYPDITRAPGWASMRRYDRPTAASIRPSPPLPSAPPLDALAPPRPVPRKRTTLPPAAAPIAIRNCRDCAKRDVSGMNPDGSPAVSKDTYVKYNALIEELKASPGFKPDMIADACAAHANALNSQTGTAWVRSDSFRYAAYPGH